MSLGVIKWKGKPFDFCDYDGSGALSLAEVTQAGWPESLFNAVLDGTGHTEITTADFIRYQREQARRARRQDSIEE